MRDVVTTIVTIVTTIVKIVTFIDKKTLISGNHPLHVAVRLMREDVIFLCLMENDQSVSRTFSCHEKQQRS